MYHPLDHKATVRLPPAALFEFDFFEPLPIQIEVSESPFTANPRPKVAVQFGEQGADLGWLRHIAGDRHGLAAKVGDLLGGLVQAGAVAIGEHQVGPVLGQRQGHGPTEPLSGAGHQRRAAGEIEEVAGHGGGSKENRRQQPPRYSLNSPGAAAGGGVFAAGGGPIGDPSAFTHFAPTISPLCPLPEESLSTVPSPSSKW